MIHKTTKETNIALFNLMKSTMFSVATRRGLADATGADDFEGAVVVRIAP